MVVRIGTNDVENLFGRAKVLNLCSSELLDEKLRLVADLEHLLDTAKYEIQDKAGISVPDCARSSP